MMQVVGTRIAPAPVQRRQTSSRLSTYSSNNDHRYDKSGSLESLSNSINDDGSSADYKHSQTNGSTESVSSFSETHDHADYGRDYEGAIKQLDGLSLQAMEQEMEDYNSAVKVAQERQALAARATYLQSLLSGNIEERERRLAPQTFGWTVKPWSLDQQPPNVEDDLHWVGTSRHEANVEFGDAPWSALRHGQVREFPLENETLSNMVFDSILAHMVPDNLRTRTSEPPSFMGGTNKQSARDTAIQHTASTVRPATTATKRSRKISFSNERSSWNEEPDEGGYVEDVWRDETEEEDADSLHADSETLCESSRVPSPYATPNHRRSRSLVPTRPVSADVRVQRPKSTSQLRLEAELEEKETRLRIELASKFRANPENEKRAGLTPEHSFHPKINVNIPDYQRQHDVIERTLRAKKTERRCTTPQPFPGVRKHEEIAKERHDRKQERSRSLGSLNSVRPRSYERPVSTEPVLPPRETKSFQLKVQHRQTLEERRRRKIEEEEQRQIEREERRKEVTRKIQTRVRMADNSSQNRRANLKEVLQEEQRQRSLEYQNEINEMRRRLDEKMCLFEQSEIENAKRRAVKDIERIVQKL
ncbi:hypothetical protein HDV05_003754 [Chytridiales sp. JEL 0842]|nr:hypothetical protein HDV05_003754 [Chytridiales sp. JEL 0842]